MTGSPMRDMAIYHHCAVLFHDQLLIVIGEAVWGCRTKYVEA